MGDPGPSRSFPSSQWHDLVQAINTSSMFRSIKFSSYLLSAEGGNGNPLQYSCLENHMDRGAWWITVYGVVQSWT